MSLVLFNKLPIELIYYILPYSYNPKPKKLLHDIKSYVSDFALISSIYFTQYKDCILLNDLQKLVDNIDEYAANHNTTTLVFSRMKCPKFSDIDQYNTFKGNFFRNVPQNIIMRKIRIIWGLLNPRERTVFFNTFILDDLDE